MASMFLLCGCCARSCLGHFSPMWLTGGMVSLVGNANLIQKVHFSRVSLVIANSLSSAFTWLIEMAVLIVALVLVGSKVLIWLPCLFVVMILLWLFATGISMIASIANVYFRDTQHFVNILFQLWFYLTPIVYPAALVVEQSDKIGPPLWLALLWRISTT